MIQINRENIFKIFLILLVLSVIMIVSLPIILSKTDLPGIIEKQISESLPYEVKIEKLSFRAFPRLIVGIKGLEVKGIQQEITMDEVRREFKGTVSARWIQLRLPLIPLLFKKVDLRDFHFDDLTLEGNMTVGTGSFPVRLEHLQGVLSQIRANRTISFGFEMDNEKKKKALESKGTLLWDGTTGSLKNLDTEIEFFTFPLKLFNDVFKIFNFPFEIKDGAATGSLKVSMKDKAIKIDSDIQTQDFAYALMQDQKELISSNFDWLLEGICDIYLEEKVLSLRETFLTIDKSKVRLSGNLQFENFSNYEFLAYSGLTDLSSMPKIFPSLNELVPLYLGFSGSIGYDLVFKANGEGSSMRGKLNLDKSVLNIANNFSKPSDYPMTLGFQVSSKDQKSYTGDLDFVLNDLNLKASIAGIDLETKKLEINFTTNKFDLKEIGPLILPLEKMKPEGGIKLYGKFNSSLQDVTQTTYEGGIVLEDLGLNVYEGIRLTDINTQIHFKKPVITTESIRFKLNDSLLEGSFQISFGTIMNYDLLMSGDILDLSSLESLIGDIQEKSQEGKQPEKAVEAAMMPSQEIKNVSAVETLKQKGEASPAAQDQNAGAQNVQELKRSQVRLSFNEVHLPGETLQNFNCYITGDPSYLRVEELVFDMAGGNVSLKGNIANPDFTSGKVGHYSAEVIAKEIDISRLGKQFEGVKEYIEGILNGQAIIQGTGVDRLSLQQNLRGSGQLFFTDGGLKTLDFLQILSLFKAYLQLQAEKSGATKFDQMGFTFTIGEGKVNTEDFSLRSKRYDLKGLGNIDFDGNVNFRVNVILGSKLSQKVSPISLAGEHLSIPVQIYNTIQDPKFSVQKAVTQELISNVLQKGLESLFGEPKQTPKTTPQDTKERSGPIT